MDGVQFGSPITAQEEQERQKRKQEEGEKQPQRPDYQKPQGKTENGEKKVNSDQLAQQVQKSRLLYGPPLAEQNEDLFDKMTRNFTADQTTFIAQFLKRFFPVVIFLIACVFGIGIGRTALVSGCLSGIYGEISIFFGAARIPMYSIPETCHEIAKVSDFLVIRPLVFLAAFFIVFYVWSYFDSQLEWRGRGNYEV